MEILIQDKKGNQIASIKTKDSILTENEAKVFDDLETEKVFSYEIQLTEDCTFPDIHDLSSINPALLKKVIIILNR